jgi:two-component system, probable response regulator PhcQ
MSRLAIVDDELPILHALERLLRAVPCTYGNHVFKLRVDIFQSPRLALESLAHTTYDLVLSDYRMAEMDGVTLLTEVRARQPDAARLILSGYADLNVLVRAINDVGIYRFIAKPWNDYELVAAIAQALHNRELMLENRRLADEQRLSQGNLSAQEFEAKRLEALEPGITKVNWGPDGSILLDPEFQDLDQS